MSLRTVLAGLIRRRRDRKEKEGERDEQAGKEPKFPRGICMGENSRIRCSGLNPLWNMRGSSAFWGALIL